MNNEMIHFKDNIYFTKKSIEKLTKIIDEIIDEQSVKEIAEHFSQYETKKASYQ